MTTKTAAQRRAEAHADNWNHLQDRLSVIEDDFRRRTNDAHRDLYAARTTFNEVDERERVDLRDELQHLAEREARLLRQRATACLTFRGEREPASEQRQALLGHFKFLLAQVANERSSAKKEAKAEVAEAKAALDAAVRMHAVATSQAAADRDERIAQALEDWGGQWLAIVQGMADEPPAPGLFDQVEG